MQHLMADGWTRYDRTAMNDHAATRRPRHEPWPVRALREAPHWYQVKDMVIAEE
jgi:hypothetical protein